MTSSKQAIEYHSSRYNLCFPYKGNSFNWVIANTYSGCIIFADDELKELITNFDPSCFQEIKNKDPEFCEYLLDNSFVIDKFINELDRIRILFSQSKYNTMQMHLTILPTIDCNLGCFYCYQRHKKLSMTPEIVEKIKKFVKDRIHNLNVLGVTWYGGEPLLEPYVIKELSKFFIKLTKKNKVNYFAKIATNGTLLDKNTVKMLVAGKVKSMQITIDGPEEVHNTRRFYLKDKKPSFRDVIEGLGNCKGKIPVGIRINVDKTNIKEYKKLVDYLEHKGLIGPKSGNFVSLGMVKPWTTEACKEKKYLLSFLDFKNRIKELKEYLLKRNIVKETSYSFTPATPCGAVNITNLLIDPEGILKKCWIHPTMDNISVGDIEIGIDFSQSQAVKWIGYDPTLDKLCSECVLLPVCCGGCPYEMMYKPDIKEKYCKFQESYVKTSILEIANRKHLKEVNNGN